MNDVLSITVIEPGVLEADRLFYVSGPRAMVLGFDKTLRELGVSPRRIKTDFFPGFA